jgi:serine/threonine-protein kinase
LSRYRLDEVLGVGGMGEVVSAYDDQIGRPVAIKHMRAEDPTPEETARFLREARIQGRLEHPAIVPVHEIQYDEQGHLFFVMKQLTGTTLAAALEKSEAASSRRAYLRAFVDVCLAIEFAHTRGIVHRDLKPSNIMLGDFGEVYVLDWGIARVIGDAPRRPTFSDVDSLDGKFTNTGAVLGTLGYMAPEQLWGEADLDGRADVYSLGCILFEVLAGKALHPRGSAAKSTTLAGVDARASVHDPDVPPELDAICVTATRVDRNDRYATARALGEAVQRFLDGDRDLEQRKQLARTELEAARAALAIGDSPAERQTAMRAAARAVALDPTCREPADLVGRLMLEPPRDVPAEVVERMAHLDDEMAHAARAYLRWATLAFFTLAPPAALLAGLRSWCVTLMSVVPVAIGLVIYLVPRSREGAMWRLALFGWLIIIAAHAVATTPFVLVPGLVLIFAMIAASIHRNAVPAPVVVALLLSAALGPFLLALVGWLPHNITVVGNTVVLTTASDRLDPTFTLIVLFGANVVAILTTFVTTRSLIHDRQEAQRTVEIQAWQLRQLVPTRESPALPSAS